jgi:hypothetical protein
VTRQKKADIIHLVTPNNSRQFQLKESTGGRIRSMTKQPRKTRYSSSNCIHDIIGFICNYFLSYHDPSPNYIVEIQDDHFQPDEPQRIEPIPIALVPTPTPIGSLDRHKPPALFPTDVKISDTYVKSPDS